MKLGMSVVGFVWALLALMFGVGGVPWMAILFGVLGTVMGLASIFEVRVSIEDGGVTMERYTLKGLLERRAEKRKEAAVVVEPELDFSGKRKRREDEISEWVGAFFDALGDERAKALVSEWEVGSRRQVLAEQLRANHEAAEKAGRYRAAGQLQVLRAQITARPDEVMPDSELDRIAKERLLWLEGGAALRAAAAPWCV